MSLKREDRFPEKQSKTGIRAIWRGAADRCRAAYIAPERAAAAMKLPASMVATNRMGRPGSDFTSIDFVNRSYRNFS
jgi:hypothetical protein